MTIGGGSADRRALLLVLLWQLAACRQGAPTAEPGAATAPAGQQQASPPRAAVHEVLPAEQATDGKSIYQVRVALEDQKGRRSGLDVLRGHPVLIALFYASCPQACPVLVRKVRQLEDRLSPAVRADLRVLLVSLDPAKDTPAELRAAAERHEVDGARWRLTRASEEDVRTLAAVLGVKYRRLEDGSYNHSSVLTLLDRSGAVIGRITSLNDSLDTLVARTEALAAPKR